VRSGLDVLLITAHTDHAALGGTEEPVVLLQKPFAPRVMLDTVRAVLDQRRMAVEISA